MYGYIYKITNLQNNKIYIGQHRYPIYELDPNYITSGTYITESINKYGLSNFSIELVDKADSKEELDNLEKYYIVEFNSKVPEGYNIADGGNSCSYWLGKKQSPESNAKRSETLKKVIHTEEWVEKIRLANKGQQPTDLCRSRSSETHKGSSWYNNGVEEHMFLCQEIPEGYAKGRLKNYFPSCIGKKVSNVSKNKNRDSHVGSMWCNDGIKEIMIKKNQTIPEGFVKGRLKKC